MNFVQLTPVFHNPIQEYFLHSQCFSLNDAKSAITELCAFLSQQETSATSLRFFVKNMFFEAAKKAIAEELGDVGCPINWISQPDKSTIPILSFQAHAITGANIQPITHQGQRCGCQFQDQFARYSVLNIVANPDLQRFEAAKEVFQRMQASLHSAGTDFSKTVRTWLFTDEILSWYKELNTARDDFFRQNDIFNKLVPASTAVGIANPFKSAMTTELIAIDPIDPEIQIRKIVSPLQCEALDYKSSFSRAVWVRSSKYCRMYVSGTASIAPDGKTAYLNDCAKQIDLTMQVVEKLIQNGGMDWPASVQGIAYFKDCRDFGLFDDYCRKAGLNIPHVKIEADVCRDDLLFELELSLMSA